MNNADTTRLWKKTLELLKPEVEPVSFKTWFEPLRLLTVEDDKIIFEVDSGFTLSVLKSRFQLLIQNAVMMVFGKEYQVDFVMEGQKVPVKTQEPANSSEAMLNPKYTFDTFVVGASNRFAHAASLAVAELPSDAYNPLFLYGGVGLGKTHLMHAIGHYILHQTPDAKLMYITSENFTNQLITAISKKTNEELRDRLRNVDVLMVDDIQFIAGKTATQEEFFHTFNELHGNGKQIIISSDRPPKEIPTLEERLRSRFEWGLIADIQKPDYETRIAILRKKAEMEHLSVDDEVLHFIAEKIESNIRELEGALTRVCAMASLNNSQLTLSVAQEALKRILGVKSERRITTELIIETISDYYKITQADLISAKRNREIAVPRQVAMYLTREMTQLSTTRIGEAFGGRDHTTVMHACDKISELEKNDSGTRNTLEELKSTIKGK